MPRLARLAVFCALAASAFGSNVVNIPVTGGRAELEWLTASSFRFVRRWDGNALTTTPRAPEVKVDTQDLGFAIQMKSGHLTLEVRKGDARVRVSDSEGKLLLEDAAPLDRGDGGIRLVRTAMEGEEYFGLGPRNHPSLALRGQTIDTANRFLFSSKGYLTRLSGNGSFHYDLAATDKKHVVISNSNPAWFEYFFHYGPGIKDSYENYWKTQKQFSYEANEVEILSAGAVPKYAAKMALEKSGCEAVQALTSSALSGILAPVVDSGSVSEAIAAIAPLLIGSRMPEFRRRLLPYLVTYLQESVDRGFPMLHPLPMQFTGDVEGWKRADQFLLGDEMLMAPLCGGGESREVYLPKGVWTEFATDKEHSGKRTIRTESAMPIFVKNGSILPLAPLSADGPMELHYFPKLGGEFFIWEPDLGEVTQVHAAPALDFARVEIESKKDRLYEWVMHHMPAVLEVSEVDAAPYRKVLAADRMAPGCWRYDTVARRLHIRVKARAGGDHIVNVSLAESME